MVFCVWYTQEHKDGPGVTENPDRDKVESDGPAVAEAGESGGAAAALQPDPGGTAAVGAKRGQVQAAVAHFSPPRTPPPSSPALRRKVSFRVDVRESCSFSARSLSINQGTFRAVAFSDVLWNQRSVFRLASNSYP